MAAALERLRGSLIHGRGPGGGKARHPAFLTLRW